MDIKINFSGTGHRYTQEEVDLVVRVMNEADPLTQGKYRNEFEEKFKNKMGLKHCFAVHTATAALELTAQLCQFNGEDELIVPSHTFTASVFPFVKQGAQIKWCDVDLETRVVTANELIPHITPKTKAVLIPHIYGFMTPMQPIMDLAKEHGFLVIEDVAQAMGTETDGIKAGAYGDFGIYSFHSHKNITTLGEGGMLAILGSDLTKIEKIIQENKNKYECFIANDNSEGQVVASGKINDIDKFSLDLKLNNIKNIKLPVSAPFHCNLMKKATEIMSKEIEKLEFKNPKNVLISNVTGKEITDVELIKKLLIKQIESRVRWRESVLLMIAKGTDKFIEIGPGKVLSGLIKRIDKSVKVSAINTEEDIKLINIDD